MLKILSLGAGVQSTALLLMSIRGGVERFDCAIFADTGWEPAAVYEHLSWLTGEAAVEMFIGISAVEQRRISPDLLKRHRYPFVFVRTRSGGRSEKRPLSGPPWWVSTADPALRRAPRRCLSRPLVRPIDEVDLHDQHERTPRIVWN